MRHTPRACTRCGWERATNSKTPPLCTACRADIRQGEHTTNDNIQWAKQGLIYRGTVIPPPKEPRP